MRWCFASCSRRAHTLAVIFCLGLITANAGATPTNGYITAVLRTGCASAPTPPPAVGGTRVGTDYVIMTVADADPNDWQNAQQLVSDAAFESLMPLYCGLPKTKTNCFTDSVQWGIVTYDTNGNPVSSGCAASGCQSHSCMGFESGPPLILIQPANQSVNSGQMAKFTVDAFGAAPLNYQWVFDGTNVLNGATNAVLVLPHAQTNQAGTYQVEVSNSLGSTNSLPALLTVDPGPAATKGYITAVLRSACASAPMPPPPVGGTRVGTNYVIMTVADADPNDFPNAQQLIGDAAFESLMPLYCALPKTKTNCVTDTVQWNIITYDTNGNPRISGGPTSGSALHSCVGFESGPPLILTQPADQAVNSGQTVTFTVDAFGAAPLNYQWVFDGTNVLHGATNAVLVLPQVQTNQAGTYQVEVSNSLGSTNSLPALLTVDPGKAATKGYITAVLRSGCASAPTPPPPIGGTRVGKNFVIMTVADADPNDFPNAQPLVSGAAFESLMPLYCALPKTNCVTDTVQWNIITYDTNGNPRISGCATSGCQYHSCADVRPVDAQPTLSISPGTTNVGFSWPTNASDFIMEESLDLVNWYPAIQQPETTTNGAKISAHVQAPPQGHLFYRLRKK
jgi:hypothetical protein